MVPGALGKTEVSMQVTETEWVNSGAEALNPELCSLAMLPDGPRRALDQNQVLCCRSLFPFVLRRCNCTRNRICARHVERGDDDQG